VKESFAFGSLISATDPVSVVALFKEMDADPGLNAIIFGESIFNDAIGIVMYDTVKNLGEDPDVSGVEEFFGAILSFTIIFVGSLVIGMVSALIVAFIQKRSAAFMRYDEFATG